MTDAMDSSIRPSRRVSVVDAMDSSTPGESFL
jgi:hypothetical protein